MLIVLILISSIKDEKFKFQILQIAIFSNHHFAKLLFCTFANSRTTKSIRVQQRGNISVVLNILLRQDSRTLRFFFNLIERGLTVLIESI